VSLPSVLMLLSVAEAMAPGSAVQKIPVRFRNS
jgi:hypothetical protein